jgi:hypothetical protein
MKKVYVAGPYTKGDVAVNVRNALDAAGRLADLGLFPFVPHLSHFWHLVFPRPYEFWCELDNKFLPYCDIVLRIPGESSGADKEVELAETLGIPVYCSIEQLVSSVHGPWSNGSSFCADGSVAIGDNLPGD